MCNVNGFLSFLKEAPVAALTVDAIRRRLLSAGFHSLSLDFDALEDGAGYFIEIDRSALFAFRAVKDARGIMAVAAHADSPTLAVLPTPERGTSPYLRLAVEKYGGINPATLLDRPLSVAGKVACRTPNGVETKTVDLDRDLFIIPSVAPHLTRTKTENAPLDPAVDLQPLFGLENASLYDLVAEKLAIPRVDLLDAELFLYNRTVPTLLGAKGELLAAPRLDDLFSVYPALCALLDATPTHSIPLLAVFDHEEVGSSTRSGAASPILTRILERICGALSLSFDTVNQNSLFISADGAHAKHPSHPEYSEQTAAPILGGGIVIKHNANRRYTTGAESAAIFREICHRRSVPVQDYANRPDISGGSTLGAVALSNLPMLAVDIGAAQLAMHSSYETAACADLTALYRGFVAVYETALTQSGDGYWIELSERRI
ncbi:MAG: M18 family aminopeptidase [Clostridia bacterium]|nr:M18 family aminopeptidase [Clostridia bacterium]